MKSFLWNKIIPKSIPKFSNSVSYRVFSSMQNHSNGMKSFQWNEFKPSPSIKSFQKLFQNFQIQPLIEFFLQCRLKVMKRHFSLQEDVPWMVGDIRRGPARGPLEWFISLEWFHSNGMILFQWNDFIPMEWFHSNGMILFQRNDFIPMEWFHIIDCRFHQRLNQS